MQFEDLTEGNCFNHVLTMSLIILISHSRVICGVRARVELSHGKSRGGGRGGGRGEMDRRRRSRFVIMISAFKLKINILKYFLST